MYAILLSNEDTPLCLYKTAHYPLAMQTFSLLEKHLNTVNSLYGTGAGALSVSNDEDLIQSLPRLDTRAMLESLRQQENLRPPIFDITLAPHEYVVQGADAEVQIFDLVS